MADLPTFRGQFPEFNGVSDGLITNMMAAATLEIDVSVWGAKSDQGTYYLTAHKLAVSPFGQNAKMVLKDREGLERTTYGQEYKLLQRQVSSGYRTF